MDVANSAVMLSHIHPNLPRPDADGAAMDTPLPARRGRMLAVAGIIALLAAAAVVLMWRMMPQGLSVDAANVRVAVAGRATFHDDVLVRASAAPLRSVMLDAVESGRVEEVLARDGASVAKGDVLFRLSNAQRRLELLQRESERAQQISNAMNMRIALEASRADRRRRLADLEYAAREADKQYRRNLALAEQGFVSASALQDAADRRTQQQRLLAAEQADARAEERIQANALQQMEKAGARLETGLRLVSETVAALEVRAPVAGRLTDFRLQVGETVKLDQHLGRIDDPARFKLAADLDEYYLNRLATGLQAHAIVNGVQYALTVGRLYPQIRDGKFALELAFGDGAAPALQPGQSLDVAITLGASAPALVLPMDAWIADGGGSSVFVLGADGRSAQRRTIRTGRRNASQVEVLGGLAPGEQVIVSSSAAYGQAARLALSQPAGPSIPTKDVTQ
jgi:HlyD family secretion protein